jgi:hypothetical protein
MRRHKPLALVALAIAVAAVASGCGGGNKSSVTTNATAAAGSTSGSGDLLPGQSKPSVFNDASLFVLTENDVPTGYVVDAQNTRARTNADISTGRGNAYLRQVESWGRITGYASGWRLDDASVQGPLQIESSASTFETIGGAEDAFAQGLKEVPKTVEQVEMKKGVGDEARMWTQTVNGQNGKLTVYLIAWRSGQVLATLATTSQTESATLADAYAYAQKQQDRIESTASKGLGK